MFLLPYSTDEIGWSSMFLTHIGELTSLNHVHHSICLHWSISWFSSVPPGICWNSILKKPWHLPFTSLPIHNSLTSHLTLYILVWRNILGFYLVDGWFESWLGLQPPWLRFFLVFLSSCRKVLGWYLDKAMTCSFLILSGSSSIFIPSSDTS
jgi:hypothetical protein